MLEVFEKIKSPQLNGLIVWVPMVPGDDALSASELVSPEKRLAMQAWDAQRSLGEAFGKSLHLKRTAWDVYLVYKPGVQWNDELPPTPTFWMHQLTGEDPKLHLNPEELRNNIESILTATTLSSSTHQSR